MIAYKKIGLVNTCAMLAKAAKEAYAVPAYNFNNMEQLQAIIQACVETKSPVILQVSSGTRKYLGPARQSLKQLYMHKINSVLGSAGKA